MKPTKAPDELIAVTKAYDLVREIMSRVAKYPRSHKFVLGDRTLNAAYDLLDLLVEAKYSHEKFILLDRANILLERMRFQIRLAYDEKLLAAKGYEAVSRQIEEVGRLVGGWRKSKQ